MPISPGFYSVIGDKIVRSFFFILFIFYWGLGWAGMNRMCAREGVEYHGAIYLAFKLTSASCFSDQAHFTNTSSRLLLVVN